MCSEIFPGSPSAPSPSPDSMPYSHHSASVQQNLGQSCHVPAHPSNLTFPSSSLQPNRHRTPFSLSSFLRTTPHPTLDTSLTLLTPVLGSLPEHLVRTVLSAFSHQLRLSGLYDSICRPTASVRSLQLAPSAIRIHSCRSRVAQCEYSPPQLLDF